MAKPPQAFTMKDLERRWRKDAKRRLAILERDFPEAARELDRRKRAAKKTAGKRRK